MKHGLGRTTASRSSPFCLRLWQDHAAEKTIALWLPSGRRVQQEANYSAAAAVAHGHGLELMLRLKLACSRLLQGTQVQLYCVQYSALVLTVLYRDLKKCFITLDNLCERAKLSIQPKTSWVYNIINVVRLFNWLFNCMNHWKSPDVII